MTDVPSPRTLPDRLVDRDQWVCWRTQERDGKPTKVPINPHTSRFGSATDPDTWSDFETARETAAKGSADGVGFVFSQDDPFVGVDLDDCRVPETGTLTDDAEAIVTQLASFTEVSPSGTGVHVLVEGSLPDGRNRRDWVECYDDARFFTVTGDHVDETPSAIESRDAELAAVYAEYIDPDSSAADDTDTTAESAHPSDTGTAAGTESAAETERSTVGHSDADLVAKAKQAANGEKFEQLWRGNTSGYDSHSEADMALCSLLAFWTGGDGQQIDRLFRESGLLRGKWDEQHFADGSTYGEKTIERVLETTDEVYEPGSSQHDNSGSPNVTDDGGDSPGDESANTSDTAARESAQSSNSDHPSTTVAQDSPSDNLPENDAELLELVDRLQVQVERLEHENQRLRSELEARPEPTATETESDSTDGWLRSLFSW